MKLLAIDTATEACSAALDVDGEVLQQYRVEPRAHSRLILPMIEELLAAGGIRRGDLDVVAFGRGPGSFMGVRIAAGVIQGIAFAYDLPVVAVSTLAAIAQRACEEAGVEKIYSAIDARMDEVYWGAYLRGSSGLVQLAGEECVARPADVAIQPGDGWSGAGTGWAAYREALTTAAQPGLTGKVIDDCLPSARAIAMLGADMYRRGETVTPDRAVPVYLRDKVAIKPGAKP